MIQMEMLVCNNQCYWMIKQDSAKSYLSHSSRKSRSIAAEQSAKMFLGCCLAFCEWPAISPDKEEFISYDQVCKAHRHILMRTTEYFTHERGSNILCSSDFIRAFLLATVSESASYL